MYLYNRSKHCSVKLVDDAFHIHSVLLDDFHEMILDIVVGLEDDVIWDIGFTMRRTPYGYCHGVESLAERMKGIKIGPGISGVAKEKLGGANGCYHLLDLFMEGMKVHLQGAARLRLKNKDTEAIEAGRRKLKGTCYYYSKRFENEVGSRNEAE